MRNTVTIAKVLMAAGIVICLLQIWLPAYYPNCDGPCHLANAAIMKDMWRNKSSIYHQFYTFNYAPNPNWLTELLLAALQLVFRAVVAEKLLLSAYVLLMTGGASRLLRQMGSSAPLWPLAFFLLIFHNALPQGFYNFSFSVAFYLWLMAAWLSFLERRSWQMALAYFGLLLLAYFSHPVSFVFGCFSSGALLVTHMASGHLSVKKGDWQRVLLVFVLCVAPFAVMLQQFANNMGGMQDIVVKLYPGRLKDLISLKHLVNYSHKEEDTLIGTGILFCLLLALVVAGRLRARQAIHRHDGFLLTLLFAFAMALLMPDAMLHGGYFALRAGIFVLLLLLLCCAYSPIPHKLLNAAAVLLYSSFVVMFFIRMPIEFKAADAIADYVSAGRYMKSDCVVLPLSYDTWGRDRKGKVITSRNNIFCHMGQYLQVLPQSLVLDNYEANTGYFPLNWRPELDPFVHLGRWPGLQAVPPAAAIEEYRQKTGVVVTDVLMMNFDPSFRQHETAKTLIAEIERYYHIAYTSPTGRTILWQRNE